MMESETPDVDQEIEVVVPEGKSLSQLTVAELSWCSKRLGTDVLTAVTEEKSPDRPMAFALVATAWARRHDPDVKLERFTSMEFRELMSALGMDRDRAKTNGTGGDPVEVEGAEEIDVNPTDSTPGPQ